MGYLAKYQTHILDVDHPYSEPLYLPVTVSFFCVCVVSLCVRAVCLCPSCVWGVCLCLSWWSSRVSVSLLVLKQCVCASLNVRVMCLCLSLCWSRVSVSLLVLEPCVCVSLSEVRATSTPSSSLTSDHLLNLTTHPHFFYNEKKISLSFESSLLPLSNCPYYSSIGSFNCPMISQFINQSDTRAPILPLTFTIL